MPEWSEVKILAEQSSEIVSQKNFLAVNAIDSKYSEIAYQLNSLIGQEIKSVFSHGKKVFWGFEGPAIEFSFGMTGSFSLEKNKHSRIEFCFEEQKIYFTDIRKFGNVRLLPKIILTGTDPMKPGFDLSLFQSILKNKPNKKIGEFLLDQKYICGIGNYLRAEILYDAKISPWRLISTLSLTEIDLIRKSIIKIITDSWNQGGATISTYRNLNGIGNYSNFFKVYKKKLDPNNFPVLRELDETNRAMWWCPAIQK